MSNSIFNTKLKFFVEHNIDPLIQRFNDALRKHNSEESGETLILIDEAIKSAAAIFTNAKEDIVQLENLQGDLGNKFETLSIQIVKPAEIKSTVMKDFAPVGINRKIGEADCSFNSSLQLIANAPGLAHQTLACKSFSPSLENYYDAQLQALPVADKVDIKGMRASFKDFPTQGQVDAFDVLQAIFEKIGFQYNLCQEFHSKFDDGTVDIEEGAPIKPETMIQLDNAIGKFTPFEGLLENFFSTHLEDGRTKVLKLEKAPEDLVIRAKIKGHTSEIPDRFEFPQEYTQKNEDNIHYELTGCILHHGLDNNGHYTSIEKKLDSWYQIDDAKVTKITPEVASSLQHKQGYIFHYRKVQISVQHAPADSKDCLLKALTTSVSIITVIARPLFQIATYPIRALLHKYKVN